MLQRNLDDSDSVGGLTWDDLKAGVPTLIALAKISSRAYASERLPEIQLLDEALAILYSARERGVLEIRNNQNAFNSIQRFLAVTIEIEPDLYLVFKSTENPEQTIRFMEGFRQLCLSGLVMHQTQGEFSLTTAGFDLAKSISIEQVESLLTFAEESGR